VLLEHRQLACGGRGGRRRGQNPENGQQHPDENGHPEDYGRASSCGNVHGRSILTLTVSLNSVRAGGAPAPSLAPAVVGTGWPGTAGHADMQLIGRDEVAAAGPRPPRSINGYPAADRS